MKYSYRIDHIKYRTIFQWSVRKYSNYSHPNNNNSWAWNLLSESFYFETEQEAKDFVLIEKLSS